MKMKRILSFVLAFVMVLTMIPVVSAVDGNQLAVAVEGLEVTHSETLWVMDDELTPRSANDGTIEWATRDNTITVMATPPELDPERIGATLTFTNKTGAPAILSFQYDYDYMSNDGSEIWGLDADAGSFTRELADGDSITITIISPVGSYDMSPATLSISNISLAPVGGEATVTFQPADKEKGSYTVNGTPINEETLYKAEIGTEYHVIAEAQSGYRFFGWSNGKQYVSYVADANIKINEDCTIYPVFVENTAPIFSVGKERFKTLDEADRFAKNGAIKTIVLMNNGVLPAGDYTISAGNTLLIPYDDANSVHTVAVPTAVKTSSEGSTQEIWENTPWEKPEPYRTLTMAMGAKITIEGSLNVGGRHSAGPFLTAGSPSGKLGMIQMAEGANITVAAGGTLYCWGYIYGDGTVTAENGATVHENIQFTDFRGGQATAGIAMTRLVFPMTQYYVQNIEVSTTFKSGSKEAVWCSLYVMNKLVTANVQFIGDEKTVAMFVPEGNGSVTKTYIPASDRLQLDINGDGSINPMTLDIPEISELLEGGLNTATFVLPINSNMTININSGTTTLNQSLALLPGTELTIAKNAVLKINATEDLYESEDLGFGYQGGYNLIVYDLEQWKSGFTVEDGEPIDTYFVYSGKRLQPVAFTATTRHTRTEKDLKDAVVDINGTLITDGFIYTTISLGYDEETESEIFEGSTPIVSTAGTGKVVMNNGAGQDFVTLQATQEDTTPIFVMLLMSSARLENKDGTYLDTAGAEPESAFDYCSRCGQWYRAGEGHSTVVEIAWFVGPGAEPMSQEVCQGTIPVYPAETPTKAFDETSHYVFVGWATTENGEPLAELPPVVGEETFYAVFTAVAHDFTNGDCDCGKEAPAPAPTGLLGDLNLDGLVNSDDLTLLARHVGEIEMVEDQALKNADVNGDGKVDSGDLTDHARYVAGIINEWPRN